MSSLLLLVDVSTLVSFFVVASFNCFTVCSLSLILFAVYSPSLFVFAVLFFKFVSLEHLALNGKIPINHNLYMMFNILSKFVIFQILDFCDENLSYIR